ncbi:MAG: general stress protein [Reyranella sp.]|uniref:pyridoxamine 5'-phosphate oxidase family protein n=1 Tax=Reyranella sp. TaxID=1929291 RepID=UPI0011FBD657|nr:pyridoxamine 5'-phosphate oxidase family protein [Reyranella sp.]TAJ96256.1 MAG: general stress protein [Reyranella sp.]TBR27634.1 MAG: general stress protein [Reyranella sp.]
MTAQTVDTSKLWDMIKDIRFGMLTVRGADGRLHSRPLTTQNGDADRGGVIWFFMSRSGQPAADLAVSHDVNVAYADPNADMYVSVSGMARIVEDPVKKQELWTMAANAWFPGGVEDPDLALVAVLAAEAEYWDVKANKAVQIFKLAKAALTGEEPADLAKHRRVRMR